MDTSYTERFAALEEEVDRAVNRAMYDGGLNHREVAEELRRIAQGWEDAA